MKCTICGCEKFISTTLDRPFKVCSNCEAMERHRALWGLIKNKISAEAKILDISPISKYLFSGFLKENNQNVKYIGVDKYRQGNPKDKRDVSFCDMYFDLVDMCNFLEEGIFDMVIMQHVLEEIVDYKKCIGNIAKVMKKDATAYLEIPNYDYLDEHLKQDANNFGNVWQFSKRKMYGELKEVFDDVKIINYEEGGFSGNFFVCVK